MTLMIKMLASGAGFAALAAAAPATAQYVFPYSPSGATQMAAQRCAAAVQDRLTSRGTNIFGVILGADTRGRVLSVTQVNPRRNSVRVHGLATTGRVDQYGVGAYGMLGYNYAPQADLSFSCNVDYRGFVRNVDINRR